MGNLSPETEAGKHPMCMLGGQEIMAIQTTSSVLLDKDAAIVGSAGNAVFIAMIITRHSN